jgi:hypothetical protein
MLRFFALVLVVFQMPVVFADETPLEKSKPKDEIARLLDRIDQLEMRVKELERQSSVPQVVGPPHQPYPNNAPYKPNTGYPNGTFRSPYTPNQNPPYPNYFPSPVAPGARSNQQNKSVPQSWRPFNFNGMEYYIIPVDEAERMSYPPNNTNNP